MIKKYNQFVNENNQVPGPNTPGSLKLDINETEAELFLNEPELGELIADQKVSLSPPHLWCENKEDTINVLRNYNFKIPTDVKESVDSKGKEELEELSKRIKELQKEYEKKAKELGVEAKKKHK
jgi:flagellar motility protein MotE (MotC chaperone)